MNQQAATFLWWIFLVAGISALLFGIFHVGYKALTTEDQWIELTPSTEHVDLVVDKESTPGPTIHISRSHQGDGSPGKITLEEEQLKVSPTGKHYDGPPLVTPQDGHLHIPGAPDGTWK